MSPSRNVTALSERQPTNLVVARLFDCLVFVLRSRHPSHKGKPGTGARYRHSNCLKEEICDTSTQIQDEAIVVAASCVRFDRGGLW